VALQPALTARDEWRLYWRAVVGGMMGYSCAALQAFALGPVVGEIEAEFGWPRTKVRRA